MGTIVVENSIIEVSRIATALVDQLPDDTFVLPQPQVYGLELDWLIVAPAGLYHLDVRDWEGEIRAHGAEPWTVLSSAGFSQKVDSPLKRLASVKGALNAFLTDEAAGQSLPLIGLLAFDGPVPDIAGLSAEIAPMSLDDAIGRMADPSGATPGLETAEERQALAQGFLDRKLALRQRASRPFVLSVGGGVRARLSARTIEQLLRLLDRHPRAGVRHLLDGSLEHWLEQEGAHHLAIVVRESLGRLAADGRAALEAFMTGSGYVGLPRSRVRPSQLNMGYVTPNDGVRKALQVQRSRGRGYVHGEAGSPDSWVRVEPTRFSGNCRFTVTIDPGSLPVGQDSKSSIVVASDVGGATHTVPLTVYVRPTPTPLVSRFIRPAMGLMAGALLGGLSGLALARALGNQGLAPGMEVVALLGAMLLWGLMGAVRGAEQPAAWPTLYALGRWTLRVLGWAAVMIAIVFSLLGLTDALIPTASKATQVLAHWQPILAGLVALAVAPGTLDDIAQARAMKQGATIELGQRLRRRAVRAAVSIAVVLGLVLAVWQLRPVYVSTRTSPSAAGVEARAEGVWEAFEAKLSSYIDGLYVRAREETKPGRVNQIDKLLGWIGVKR